MVDAVADRRAVPTPYDDGVEDVDDILVEPASAACGGGLAGERRMLEFEVATLVKPFRCVQDQIVVEPCLGQRVVLPGREWPSNGIVEFIEHGQVRVQACPIDLGGSGIDSERVVEVIQIAEI